MNSHSLKVLVLCFILLVGLSFARAQQQTPRDGPDWDRQDQKPNAPRPGGSDQGQMVLKEYTSLVNLTVTVTDKHNRLVSGLRREHFEIFEDNVKQAIEFFTNEDTPLSVGIIFDVSESMQDKLGRAREALGAFIRTCHNNDDFFLITFNQRPTLTGEFSNGDTLMRNLASVYASGGTALYDAIYMGVEEVQRGRHSKRALLVISDGQDNSSHHTYRELGRLLKEANVQIHCIGIVDPFYFLFDDVLDSQGRGVLESIAKVSGGKAFFPRKKGELEDIVTRIALELRRQYSIGYTPTNQERDGRWRKIKVRLIPPSGQPELVVRAREGYYAVPN